MTPLQISSKLLLICYQIVILFIFGGFIRALYTSWKTYLEEVDRFSKNRLAQFDQIVSICDTLKQMKTHKTQMGKKAIDHHLK